MSTPLPSTPIDRLGTLLERFHVHASLFHSGPLCGRNVFEPLPGRAFLHVLRRGPLSVRHHRGQGVSTRLEIDQPTLLLYPRPLHHEFINPPADGPDFTCATLDFDGGAGNPIVQSLPALVAVPLAAVDGLDQSLGLLFAEADRVRCGSRLLADRLFEVVLIQVLRWILDHPTEAGVSTGTMMGLSDPRLARAMVAIHEAPQDPWPLEQMAAKAGMSRSAFASAFRSATGVTPAAYLGDWRLSVATAQLRAGRSAKQVAASVGFSDTAALSKAFRRRMGTSPRAWLAAQR